jgi:4-alpha-glucanotransferase
VAYCAVPKTARYALSGRWSRGPGRAVFDAAARSLGDLPLIAEDLGVITPAVEKLRDDLGLPGMAVLQFGLDSHDRHSPHRMENHREHQVVYTGTHDHDTIRGWYDALGAEGRAMTDAAIASAGVGEPEPHWSLIRLAFTSRARVAMIQAQDVLGLGSEARMNRPGTASGSWRWRLEAGALTPELVRRLRAATEAAGRLRA